LKTARLSQTRGKTIEPQAQAAIGVEYIIWSGVPGVKKQATKEISFSYYVKYQLNNLSNQPFFPP
jgi:hypothetical protein